MVVNSSHHIFFAVSLIFSLSRKNFSRLLKCLPVSARTFAEI